MRHFRSLNGVEWEGQLVAEHSIVSRAMARVVRFQIAQIQDRLDRSCQDFGVVFTFPNVDLKPYCPTETIRLVLVTHASCDLQI